MIVHSKLQKVHQRVIKTPLCYAAVILLCFFIFTPAKSHTQSFEHLTVSNPESRKNIAGDTSALLIWIAVAQTIKYQYPDSAIKILTATLRSSEFIDYAKGMRLALRPLLDLSGLKERRQLINELLPVCTFRPALHSVLPVLYNAAGLDDQLQGQYDKAADMYMTAIDAAKRSLPGYLAVAYNNYGSLISLFPEKDRKDNEQSLYYLDAAEKIARKEQDIESIICVLCNKAKISRNGRMYEKSLNFSRKALRLAKDFGYKKWEYVLLNNIGDVYNILDQPDSALKYLNRSLTLREAVKSPYYQNLSTITLGEVYLKMGNLNKAKMYFSASLQSAVRHQIPQLISSDHEQLSTIFASEGRYKEAFKHLSAHNRLEDSLRQDELMKNIQRLSVKYQASEKDKKLLKNQLHIARQNQLLQQKNRLLIAIIIGAGIMISMTVIRFRHKKKMLTKDEEIREMKAIIKGEEQERIRLAQDLHDGIGGMLAAINMHIDVAKRNDFKDKTAMQNIIQMLEKTANEVRLTSHNLMPSALLRQNLEEAIRYYCSAISKNGKPNIELNIYGAVNHLPPPVMSLIFRATQELIHNILRHAEAGHVVISLEKSKKITSLIVEDDGKGFSPANQNNGFGLENLKFKVRALGGTFEIRSKPGVGTSVMIHFL